MTFLVISVSSSVLLYILTSIVTTTIVFLRSPMLVPFPPFLGTYDCDQHHRICYVVPFNSTSPPSSSTYYSTFITIEITTMPPNWTTNKLHGTIIGRSTMIWVAVAVRAKIKPPADINDSSHVKSHDEPCRRPKQQNQQPNYQTKPPPMRKTQKRPRRRNLVALLPCGRRYSHCDRSHRSIHRPGGNVRTAIFRPQRRPRQPHRYERMERGESSRRCA